MAQVNKAIPMTNISDKPVTIQIGGAPGDGVTEHVIAPGESQQFHENLCKPVPGAGRTDMPAIIERMSMRTFPDGVRRPALVPAGEAKMRKAEYDRAIETWKKAGSPAPKTAAVEPPAR